MTELMDLPDLVDAADPLEWAADNLALLGRGETASVFAHPDDPTLAIRISDYPDGWFGYATALSDILDGDPDGAFAEALSRHAPVVLDMRYLDREGGGLYAGLTGRLSPVDGAMDDVAAARAILSCDHPPCLDGDEPGALEAHARAWASAAVVEGRLSASEAEAFLSAQPLFLALAQALPSDMRDLRDGNFMRRGGHLVLNDPSGAMSPRAEAAFKEHRRLSDSSMPGSRLGIR
jgi:hypothetical protein